jgi:hypothetical protein
MHQRSDKAKTYSTTKQQTSILQTQNRRLLSYYRIQAYWSWEKGRAFPTRRNAVKALEDMQDGQTLILLLSAYDRQKHSIDESGNAVNKPVVKS